MTKKTFKGIRVVNRDGMYLFFAKWDDCYSYEGKRDQHRKWERCLEVSPKGVSQDYANERAALLSAKFQRLNPSLDHS